MFDLPEVVLAVTEHQAERKHGPCCGAASQAAFPAGVSQPTPYGPRIRAQMVYFHSGQFVPLARTADMLADLYGQAVSETTISAAVAEAAQRVSPVTEALRTYLVDTPEAVHLDESGARVAGKLHWVHSAGTAQVTLYGIHPKRGSLGMDALGVLPRRHGWCVHDGWRAYNRYAVRHALCNAHHLRELTFIHERYQQQWAADLRPLLGQMKTAVARARAAGYSTLPLDQDAYFRLRYDRLLDAAETEIDAPAPPTHGRAPKNSPPTNLLNRLRDGRTQVLAFMTDFSVPFDNNPAERDIRMLKVQQKVAGGFRTLPGADLFCTVRSYLATAHKNGQSLLAALTHAFHGQPYIPPCLLPPHLGSYVNSFVLEGLVDWGKDSKIGPSLATSWQFSQDQTVVTFKLRKGVKFQDGTDFNAYAVKTNFARILNATPRLAAYTAFKDSVDKVVGMDDWTIRIRLKGAHSTFLYDLASSYAKMMSPASLKRSADAIALNPVGTDPFSLQAWVPNDHITLTAFQGYWGGVPQVASAVLKPIPDSTARLKAFQAHTLDVALSPAPQDIAGLSSNSQFQVYTAPSTQTFVFEINLLKQPFADKRVRQALNYAIDKQNIAKTVYQGYAAPLDSPLAAGVNGYAPIGNYAYDPQKARDLLTQAGVAQGLKLALWTSSGAYLADKSLSDAVAGYLRAVGLDVQETALDTTTYRTTLQTPSTTTPPAYDLVFLNAQSGTGDAEQAWKFFLDSRAWPSTGLNGSFYKNASVDSPIDQLTSTLDDTSRNGLYKQIQATVWDDAPWIFLVNPQQTLIAWTNVKGVYFTPSLSIIARVSLSN